MKMNENFWFQDITLKSYNIEKSFEVPPSKKLTVHLNKGDVLVVGNTTFLGKYDVPTKIVYHTVRLQQVRRFNIAFGF
jgi:hypothetical protein